MVDEAERSLHDALSVLSQTVKETRDLGRGVCRNADELCGG
jgi:T-complex protein 1 subunit beta